MFADIQAAFYSIMPEVILGAVLSLLAMEAAFTAMGLTTADMTLLMSTFTAGTPLLEQLHVEAAGCRAVADWRTMFWLQVPSGCDQVHPRLGTRPGDPLADLVFNLGFAMFQHLLDQELHKIGVIPSVKFGGRVVSPSVVDGEAAESRPLLPVVFMDDLAIPLTAATAPEIFENIEVTCSILVDLGRTIGLAIDFASRKTEAIALLLTLLSCEAADDGGSL